jgi:hypothetical protein
MARYQDSTVTGVLVRHLYPGEQLQYWAYGVRDLSYILRVLLNLSLAILPGMIIARLFRKEYLVGLTSHRMLILRVQGRWAYVQEITEYPRWYLPPARISGVIATSIRLYDPQRPFRAKFPGGGMPYNRQHAAAIAAVLLYPAQQQQPPPPQQQQPPQQEQEQQQQAPPPQVHQAAAIIP